MIESHDALYWILRDWKLNPSVGVLYCGSSLQFQKNDNGTFVIIYKYPQCCFSVIGIKNVLFANVNFSVFPIQMTWHARRTIGGTSWRNLKSKETA